MKLVIGAWGTAKPYCDVICPYSPARRVRRAVRLLSLKADATPNSRGVSMPTAPAIADNAEARPRFRTSAATASARAARTMDPYDSQVGVANPGATTARRMAET